VAKLVARLLATAAYGRHQQRSGQQILARQKYTKKNTLIFVVTPFFGIVFFYCVGDSFPVRAEIAILILTTCVLIV
jgi:hypothetical protein